MKIINMFKDFFKQEYKPVIVTLKCPNCRAKCNVSPHFDGLDHKSVHVCKACGVLFSPKVLLKNKGGCCGHKS